GRMSGILLGGVMIQALGYRNAFLVLLGIVTVGWFLVHFLPPLEKKTTSMVASFHHLPELIKERPLQLATVICFFSALLLALTESFFPIWFKDLGFTESMIGVLVTFRGVGGIISSLLFGRLSQLLTKERLFQMCTVLAGLVLMPIPFIGAAVPLIIGIAILVGAATSIGSVLYISMVAEHSSIQNRGIAMALAGTAWSLAYAIGPVPFSQLADLHGVANAFLAVGLLFLITGSFAKFFFHKILSAHPKMR
ncbi:MAG: MFS transporter, partial [Desulfobacterales bacterium]|nr:MFS transporter [Desulfobacterales bacterium]